MLDNIEQSANRLRTLRQEEDLLQVADLENSIGGALRDIEFENGQLGRLMGNLTRESAQFETLVIGADNVMRGLGERFAALTNLAGRLERADSGAGKLSAGQARQAGDLFDELYLQYTMVRERDVHLKQCDRFQLICKVKTIESDPSNAGTEDALFF